MVLVLRLRQLGNLALQEANSEIKVGEAVGVAPGNPGREGRTQAMLTQGVGLWFCLSRDADGVELVLLSGGREGAFAGPHSPLLTGCGEQCSSVKSAGSWEISGDCGHS